MSNGPNFLNRKKQGLNKTETGASDLATNLLGLMDSQDSPKFLSGEQQSPLQMQSSKKPFSIMALGQKK